MGQMFIDASGNYPPPDLEAVPVVTPVAGLPEGSRRSHNLQQNSAHTSHFSLSHASTRKRHTCWQQAQRVQKSGALGDGSPDECGRHRVLRLDICPLSPGGLLEDQDRSCYSPAGGRWLCAMCVCACVCMCWMRVHVRYVRVRVRAPLCVQLKVSVYMRARTACHQEEARES